MKRHLHVREKEKERKKERKDERKEERKEERKKEKEEKKEDHGKIATCEQQFSVTAETGSHVPLS